MTTEHSFDQSGIFEIHLVGQLELGWVERMNGMTYSVQRSDAADEWITVLLGPLPDQTALNGLLNALYTRQLTLRYVAMQRESDASIPSGPSHGGDET